MMENSINANAGQFGYNALGTEQYQFYAYAPQNNYTIGDDQDLNIVWYKEEAFSQNFKAELVEPFTVTKKEFANSTNQYDHNQFTLTGSVKIETASKQAKEARFPVPLFGVSQTKGYVHWLFLGDQFEEDQKMFLGIGFFKPTEKSGLNVFPIHLDPHNIY